MGRNPCEAIAPSRPRQPAKASIAATKHRATFCYYRVGGLISRGQRELAVAIIETEIRSAQHEMLLEAARLVLSGEPVEIARKLREMAERTIRPMRKLSH